MKQNKNTPDIMTEFKIHSVVTIYDLKWLKKSMTKYTFVIIMLHNFS